MNTILVPTDYSATARNAALYALELGKAFNIQKIIFYNAYQAPPMLTETTAPIMPVIDIDILTGISNHGMDDFIASLKNNTPAGITIAQKTSLGIVSDGITEYCKECNADFIVMGITGTSKMEEVLIGSTATSVTKQSSRPVIIVPAGAKYTPLKNIMFACDYKNVAETIPVEAIKNVLKLSNAALHVVNVYKDDADISADKTYQQHLLQSMLTGFEPSFHFIKNTDFISGINEFVEENSIDMIITVYKKHGFFEGLFKERHTKQLAFHSHVPLMSVRQDDL